MGLAETCGRGWSREERGGCRDRGRGVDVGRRGGGRDCCERGEGGVRAVAVPVGSISH